MLRILEMLPGLEVKWLSERLKQSSKWLWHIDTNEQSQPASQKADQPGRTVAPWRHLARLREKGGESKCERERKRGALSASDTLLPLHFPQFSFQRLNHTPPSSLHATVHTARPNKGQVPAFLLRTSFASCRQTASQGLFKGPANPIRLLICEALSP